MPKGGLLHSHLDATVDAAFLLDLALKQPAIHVQVPDRLTVSNITSILPEFRALPSNEFSSGPGITGNSYTSGSWVSIQSARMDFDAGLGGPEGFDQWVISAMTINPTEAYNTHNTVEKVC